MAVRIRLTRIGRKKRPYYRIVVMDSRAPRDGRFIENIGTYNPIEHPIQVTVNEERANYWMDQGAKPSATVKNIFQKQGVMLRRHMIKKGYDEARIEEELKKWELMQADRERRKIKKAEDVQQDTE